MAEWTNLPDQEPGNPALASWSNAVRDNAVAIAEGSAGAPRVSWQSAVQKPTAGTLQTYWFSQTGGGQQGAPAWPTLEQALNAIAFPMPGSFPSVRIGIGGTVRLRFTHAQSGTGSVGWNRVRVYRLRFNEARTYEMLQQWEASGSFSPIARQLDIVIPNEGAGILLAGQAQYQRSTRIYDCRISSGTISAIIP